MNYFHSISTFGKRYLQISNPLKPAKDLSIVLVSISYHLQTERFVMFFWSDVPHALLNLCKLFRKWCHGWSSMSPRESTLYLFQPHWLPVAAHIKFKMLMGAYKTATGTGWLFFLLKLVAC